MEGVSEPGVLGAATVEDPRDWIPVELAPDTNVELTPQAGSTTKPMSPIATFMTCFTGVASFTLDLRLWQ